MEKKSNLILLLLAWAVFLACSGELTEQGAKGPLQAEAMVVRFTEFSSLVSATAELLAREQAELKAPVAGQVLEIHFKEGQKVRKGEAIIRIDDRAWNARLEGLKVEFESVSRDLERKKTLLGVEGASQEEIDAIASRAASLRAAMNELEVQISQANVRAPFEGQLGMRNFSVGAYLKEGDLITTVTDHERLKVDFDLAQEYEKSIAVGRTVMVLLENDTLVAEIYAVDPQIDRASRTVRVRALLNQRQTNTIMPGSFAEVIVAANHTDSALLVPSQAIVPQINDETVFVFRKGKAFRVKITTGERSADMVRVLSGLRAGDTVLTTGLLFVKDGMPVQLMQTNNGSRP